jgi:hypothetical protein
VKWTSEIGGAVVDAWRPWQTDGFDSFVVFENTFTVVDSDFNCFSFTFCFLFLSLVSIRQLAGYTVGYEKLRFTSIKGVICFESEFLCILNLQNLDFITKCGHMVTYLILSVFCFFHPKKKAPQFMPDQAFQMFENYLNGHFPVVKPVSQTNKRKPRAQ